MRNLFDDNRKQNQHLSVRRAIVQTACLLLLFAVSYGFAQPAIPSTPAGQTLQAWLDAFNSGDRAKLAAYVKNTDPSESVEGMMGFHSQTGGFNLLSIESSEPLSIIFRVKEKGGPTEAVGVLQVKDTSPPTVDRFLIRALPPGAVIEDIKLDGAERQRVIDGAIAMLNEFYVYADVAKKMEDALRAHQKQGDYDAITNGNAFATLLTTHLRDVSHDRHLGVDYNPFKVPTGAPGPHPPTAEDQARMRRQLERSNCAFEKAEILSPNIGYLKFNGFMDPAICGATVAAAMNFLAHTDAIIFDLRENGGGDPAMVTFISSYLFDHSTHLNDLYNRKADTTTQYWTTPFVPGERFIDKPVFVLTSKFTFSGAEEFTYNLKNLKRATIVGETTGGGAHPVSGHPIDNHFSVRTPFARAINPISKTNWEGTGIEPDVKVSAAEALDTAKKLAVEKVQQKQPDGSPKKAAPSSN